MRKKGRFGAPLFFYLLDSIRSTLSPNIKLVSDYNFIFGRDRTASRRRILALNIK